MTVTYDPATQKVVPKDAVVLDPTSHPLNIFRTIPDLRRYAGELESLTRSCAASIIDLIADQIEEFEAQTRPAIEEPTGLGAVVEDERGTRWVRVGGGAGFPWRKSADEFVKASWDSVRPVRIISEGVQ